MEHIVQALMALALLAPVALTAPGVLSTNLYHQGQQKPMNGLMGPSNTMHTIVKIPPPAVTLSAAPRAEQQPGMASSSPLELRRDKHSDNSCTPGDRQCHASLEYVLFCNDNHQWVQYSECQSGTFCHRLHLICVVEVSDTASSLLEHNTPRDGGNGNHADCKEGDRRCSITFNRVDRCNSNNEWITYHDCRKAELCDSDLQECLPKISITPEPTSTDNDHEAIVSMTSATVTSTPLSSV